MDLGDGVHGPFWQTPKVDLGDGVGGPFSQTPKSGPRGRSSWSIFASALYFFNNSP